jgi:hypothetical protein
MSIILNYINYFWKLGFREEFNDIYTKEYNGLFKIQIDMKNELIDYEKEINVWNNQLTNFSQRNFVIFECIDRLLTKGYHPQSIHIGKSKEYDISVITENGETLFAIKSSIWEYEFDQIVTSLRSDPKMRTFFDAVKKEIPFLCIYTSRLKAGLIEYRNIMFSVSLHGNEPNNDMTTLEQKEYSSGIFEENIKPYRPRWGTEQHYPTKVLSDFEIENDTLMKYKGNEKDVKIPEGVKRIRNSLFWNFSNLESVSLPDSLTNIGGDTFFNCSSLRRLTIPRNVEIMGDNPFANCPVLELKNDSPHFIYNNGALYNKEQTRLIYYSMRQEGNEFTIPDGVISVGKHAFYNCARMESITIPESVTIIENNPFSNCPLLNLINNSKYFILEEGALYNKLKTTLFYYPIKSTQKSFSVANGVKIIGRHSFYNCRKLEALTIPSSVEIIGYNPFAGCTSLKIINHSPNYYYENGALYDKTKNEIIFYSACNPTNIFDVPSSVKIIGRSAFLGGKNITQITLPDGLEFIDRSAFANCTNLKDINIPDSVKFIEEWAFNNCKSLKEIVLPENTVYQKHTFLDCPAKITRNMRRSS